MAEIIKPTKANKAPNPNIIINTDSMNCGGSTLKLEGSAIGALLRQDAIERAPMVLEVGHETTQRLGLSFRF